MGGRSFEVEGFVYWKVVIARARNNTSRQNLTWSQAHKQMIGNVRGAHGMQNKREKSQFKAKKKFIFVFYSLRGKERCPYWGANCVCKFIEGS